MTLETIRRHVPAAALFAAVALVAVCAFAPTSFAQNKKQAGMLAEQAKEAFGNKNFLQAAELLTQAYDYFPEPNFIWNTARAYELGGEVERAEDAYLRFAALNIGNEEREEAYDKAARLRTYRLTPNVVAEAQDGAELVALRSTVTRLEEAVANAPTDGGGGGMSLMALGGWSATAAGLVALGAVGTLHLASVSTVEEYHDAASTGQRGKYDALKDTLEARVVTSQVLSISGIALLGTGITLLYFEYFSGPQSSEGSAGEASPQTLRLAPFFGPDAAGVGLGGAF